jgi:hypothetical protein
VAIFRNVCVVPGFGPVGGRWAEAEGSDAFARSARSVCELYYDALSPIRIQHWVTALTLQVSDQLSPGSEIAVEVMPSTATEGANARVLLPAHFCSLAPAARAMSVVDVVHEALVHLGRRYRWDEDGWDLAVLEAARARVIEHGLVYAWTSPWKAGRNRRWNARAKYWLAPDGWGRAVLEIRRSADGAVMFRSQPFRAFLNRKGLQHSARTIAWTGDDTVEFSPWVEPSQAPGEPVIIEIFDDDARFEVRGGPEPDQTGDAIGGGGAASSIETLDLADVPQRPSVTVVQLHYPGEVSEIAVAGVGPMDGVHDAYRTGLLWALDQLTTPEWDQWWRPAQANLLSVCAEVDPVNRAANTATRSVERTSSIRTTQYIMTATIQRAASSTIPGRCS